MNQAIETVNEKLNELITSGDSLVWARPWKNVWKPVNGLTGRGYTAGNLLCLILYQLEKGYSSGVWMTFNQMVDWNNRHEGEMRVRKGQRGAPVVVPLIRENDEGESEIFAATYKTVFNLDQLDNVPMERFVTAQQRFEAVASMDNVFTLMSNPPAYRVGGAAYYTPKTDEVTLPKADLFRSGSAYYLTKAHETIHATGHSKRLNRFDDQWTDGQAYSFEELIAELGAVYLCARAGLEMEQGDFDNSAAYLQGWKSALKDNREWFTRAAALAVKAVDCVLGAKE